MDRYTIQLVIEKLDRNAITLFEAREFLAKRGISVDGRTKSAFTRSLCKLMASIK